jgi:hypothetical protein
MAGRPAIDAASNFLPSSVVPVKVSVFGTGTASAVAAPEAGGAAAAGDGPATGASGDAPGVVPHPAAARTAARVQGSNSRGTRDPLIDEPSATWHRSGQGGRVGR